MSQKLLLPNRYKTIGWWILIPAAILGIMLMSTDFEGFEWKGWVFAMWNDEILGESSAFSFVKTNVTNTVAGLLFLVGALLVGFSKEKREDEFIANLRLSSLLWAVLVNSILLLLSFMFIYGIAFLHVMIYNMFTVLIIFIVRFNFILYKNAKNMSDEK